MSRSASAIVVFALTAAFALLCVATARANSVSGCNAIHCTPPVSCAATPNAVGPCHETVPVTQDPGRAIWCSNTLAPRSDGSMGTTLDILATDVPTEGGRLAWWVDGVGATCDYPALIGAHYTGYYLYEGLSYEEWSS
jgi:hypothetical protein